MPHSRQTSSSGSSRPSSRLENARAGVNRMFSGRSRVGTAGSNVPESPKTPRAAPGLQNLHLPSTRIVIPYLTRTYSQNTTPAASPRSSRHPYTSIDSRSIAPQSSRQQREEAPISRPSHSRQNSQHARRFVGVDPAELHLAELAEAGRRRRRQKSRGPERKCFPQIKNRKIRSKILSCFISGLFLALVLVLYLALALNRNESEEFHVLLILIILVTTIFFCHALIRLCMMIVNPPADSDLPRGLLSMVGPGGYANPVVPIRVNLARDEEAAGIESDATKIPPPPYGLWRESVRVDPNRIFWQRNEAPPMPDLDAQREARPATANRPPSYMSDDGIDYVIEAEPRSIAPTTNVPLLPHPSERRGTWSRGQFPPAV